MKHVVILAQCCLLLHASVTSAPAEQARRFSLKDDIELRTFLDVEVSPKRNWVVAHTEHASLEDGLLHDTMRIYNLRSIRQAVVAPTAQEQVEPEWMFERVTKDPGGNTERVSRSKWLSDESGFAFLFQVDPYHHRLFLARISSKEVVPLSEEGEDVLGFDIRDSSHYVFTISSREAQSQLSNEVTAPYRVGTGHSLEELAFPQSLTHFIQRGELWAALGGPPFRVIDADTQDPVSLYSAGNESLGLSPDGQSLVTLQAVADVPEDWIQRYPPPYQGSAFGLKPGRQDLTAPYDGWTYVSEWVRIYLKSGKVDTLTSAPDSLRAGWWESHATTPRWSEDGSSILLPGTFLETRSVGDTRPCIAVVQSGSKEPECVRTLKKQLANGYEAGWEVIEDADFVPGRNDEIVLKHEADRKGDLVFRRLDVGRWEVERNRAEPVADDGLLIAVNQDFRHSPVLIATDVSTKRSRVILDPNPELKDLLCGDPELYTWRDRTGRKWQGILYKPVGFRPHQSYPLVIQNHGFNPERFTPSGAFPSAFVAEELASAGIMVLQVRDCAGRGTPIEGPCNVEGYEGAVAQLSNDGLIDSARVGIIGFSRTVFYVLEALTKSRVRFKAASITDGITGGYMDYLESVGLPHDFLSDQASLIGSEPFGPGLAQWLRSSPDFRLDKVTAPLRVVTTRAQAVMRMWEPYAVLEAMHKPVDLVVLNTDQHVLEDPQMRQIAQGGNLDWFRFWLQGYEDPDPAKQAEYARWTKLRDGLKR